MRRGGATGNFIPQKGVGLLGLFAPLPFFTLISCWFKIIIIMIRLSLKVKTIVENSDESTLSERVSCFPSP